jgi:N-acyl-L-homoserine lactone synthetase
MVFTAYPVTEKEELKEIYRLRYKIYVVEWGFEKPENHPNGFETDEFDEYSVHFATRADNGELVGTIRLILNPPGGFPIERHCEIDTGTGNIPRDKIAEVSRLAISKNYRKRIEDKYIYGPDEERRSIGSFHNFTNKINYKRFDDRYRLENIKKNPQTYEKRVRPEAVISLFKAVYHESKKREITHWYAIMTKGLFILLRKLGINFQPIGDPVDYHGIRTPFMGEIKRIENEVSVKNPDLYEEFVQSL